MDITVAVFLVVVVVVFLAWLAVARTPVHDRAGERPGARPRRPVEHEAPGPAGAEDRHAEDRHAEDRHGGAPTERRR